MLSFDSQKNLKACKTGGRKIPVFHFKGLFLIIVHGTVAHFSRMSVIKAKSEPLPAMTRVHLKGTFNIGFNWEGGGVQKTNSRGSLFQLVVGKGCSSNVFCCQWIRWSHRCSPQNLLTTVVHLSCLDMAENLTSQNEI